MTNAQVKRLLKKKKWKGAEIGKLLLATTINDIKRVTDPDLPPVLTQEEFAEIESTIDTEAEYSIYGVYKDLQFSIIDSFNRGQGLYQQFYNGYYRYLATIRETTNAEDGQKSLKDAPLIMTEEQYNRIEAKARKKLLDVKESFFSVLFTLLEDFINDPDGAPDPVKKALEALEEAPADRSYYYSSYNELFGEGYYTLPDGTRSDQLSREEWSEAFEKAIIGDFKYYVDGELQGTEETLREIKQNIMLTRAKLDYEGVEYAREAIGKPLDAFTDEEIEAFLSSSTFDDPKLGLERNSQLYNILSSYAGFPPSGSEWHTYETPPEDLTMYDMLDAYTLLVAESTTTAEKRDVFKHFQKDLPELCTAMKACIEELIPEAVGLKPNQLYKDLISREKLSELGLPAWEELTTPNEMDIIDAYLEEQKPEKVYLGETRGLHKGIAIIKNPSCYDIDEAGNYKEPENPLQSFLSLASLEGNTEEILRNYSYLSSLMEPALSYLYCFNSLLEVLERVYDISELAEVAQCDTKTIESQLQGLNGTICLFYHEITGTPAERKRKRKTIKEAFPLLDPENSKPSKEALQAIEAELTNLGFSAEARRTIKYLDPLIDLLMDSRLGAPEYE